MQAEDGWGARASRRIVPSRGQVIAAAAAVAAIVSWSGPRVNGSVQETSTAREVQTPAQCGRLSLRGTEIACRDGTRFHWRGVTAFALLEQMAHGRHADADTYLRWARATGFNLVRVLAMADGLFRLTPDDGRQHLAALFTLAAERGLYVEIVALADTAAYRMDLATLRDQVAAVGTASDAHDNVVVQIANEHYHPTQSRDLHALATLRGLGTAIPTRILYTESAAAEDTAREPQGEYVTRHLSRGEARPEMLDRLRLLGGLQAAVRKPVVNDEPIGAAERDEPGRRAASPAFFRALGERTTAAGLAGATFHCESCLYARVPGAVQQACAEAWTAGLSVSSAAIPRFP